MNNAEFQLRGVGDPRLAMHATSACPAWLWSVDGTRIWWANPVAAKLFGAGRGAALTDKVFGPADPHRRQVAQLAGQLLPSGETRLERLRGFGAPLGMLVTCGCARLDFADGHRGILIVAAEAVGRAMPLAERLRRLVEAADVPIAAFTRDGMMAGASDAARAWPGFRDLTEAGLERAGGEALKQGRAEMPIGGGHVVLQRVGAGADVGLVALIGPDARQAAKPRDVAPAAERPMSGSEQPATSGQAPAGFAVIDAFADPPPEPDPRKETDMPHVEAPSAETSAQAPISDIEEPSPYIEAVADEPADAAPSPAEVPAWIDGPAPDPHQHPLRFLWQMDAQGRFSLGSDEFTRLIGLHTAAGFGRLWNEIAEVFGLDPEGRILKAAATREAWTGITLNWPTDGGGRLPVELSGLPIFDRTRNFAGYRGFGICRDLDGLTRLAALRRFEMLSDPPTPQVPCAGRAAGDADKTAPDAQLIAPSNVASSDFPPSPEPMAEASRRPDPEMPADPPRQEMPENVVPFPLLGDPRSAALTPVENNAFNELARQLSARLESENLVAAAPPAASEASDAVTEPPAPPHHAEAQPGWLAPPEPPARGEARDKALLDLLPAGVLIYRLDRLLYANAAFLARMGYPSLHALEQAGGLDALYVEPGVSSASSTSDTGTPVTISAAPSSPQHPEAPGTDARLYTIAWEGDSALALIFSSARSEDADAATANVPAVPASEPSAVGHANAEELGAILDTMADGIVMFDAGGNLNSCNRSAEALLGYDGAALVQRHLAQLFAPESQRVVRDYLDGLKGADIAGQLDHGRDVLGRERGGGLIPLSITMGRTRPDGPNFFAVLRDQSQSRKSEGELQQARRLAERAANAKADLLARISHEVRTPLNAIIGFAEVMIGERFGTLGERYVEYMKDIRSSGERVITIINDLLDLSRIETGKLDLAFAKQNLNDLVENCVAVMQPQANRERIIIRSSLAHALPPVLADAHALRQITLNLIGNSIHLANAGGQVIVSTALSDFGDVVLRVRDTGHGLNDNEVAAAMEPFRTQIPSDQASDSGVSLSLTKALVEANRAQFHIKTGAHSGTLVEVVFARAMA